MEAAPEKKRKIESDNDQGDIAPPVLCSFKGFDIEKVIAENSRNKTTTIHAKMGGKDAIVLLEKTPFDLDHVKKYLSDDTALKNTLKNDIYGTYEAFLPPTENAIKAVVIHPATEKHIQKYSDQERYIIRETPELYSNVTLPLLQSRQFSMQWVYNILEKKQEADRIVFEDPDPETGFILLPDMKWDRKDKNALYLVGIVHKHDVRSLRDLDDMSLPLLRNILIKGREAIKEKYNIPASRLHVYIHYQPSYYHFHMHFTHIKLEAPGFGADRAHLLTDVIENIEMMSEYYKKRTLTFVVREQEDLYIKYKENGYFEKE
ncbi:m7GpppX diphosphatase-like [Ruditapes philippinarum]|uniref:m7GpppX diphosphatase-like n=1 Tax=Ruditapes philippinarum TaxID=129788 RepID=UPI00295AC6E6|nr:m7GpppX diphosphatase-like [Ruditapes philippinarum]